MSLKKILQLLKFFIGWPISALAIVFIVKLVLSQESIIQKIQNVNLWILFLGLVTFLPYFILRAILWQKILKEKGNYIPHKDSMFSWESSEIKRFAPGFIWPMVSRTIAFSNEGMSKRDVAYSIFIEIEAFLIGCMIFSCLSIPLIYNHILLNTQVKFLLISFFILLTLSSVTIFTFSKAIIKFIKKRSNISIARNQIAQSVKNSLPHFTPTTNLSLLAYSLSNLFFFGFGTYLVISSITFLTPSLFLQFLGFFVFSLFIGYMSLITPMGIGVREGVLILGLTPFMPLAIASASALYARVGLIISELIFFQFTIIWKNARNRILVRLENLISSHKKEILVAAAILAYITYFNIATFMRYDNFYTGRFDLGDMDQTVWNTLHGRIFQASSDNGAVVSRLSAHADFILILISPLYKIWADPRMLLLLQTIVVALGAIFIFKLANMILGKNSAVVFSILFLLNPALQYTNLYDFHPVTLATTLLLGTFYFLIKKRYVLFLIFAILSGITKEEVWAIIGLLGAYILFFELFKILKKEINLSSKHTLFNLIFGTAVASSSFFIFYYITFILIPHVRGGQHFALSYYSDLGSSPLGIVKSIIFSPTKIIHTIATNGSLSYLFQLFAPVGFIALFSPIILIFAAPDLLIDLLSNNLNLHQIYYQYSATITPFIFIATIFGFKNLIKLFPKKNLEKLLLIFLSITTLTSAYIFGPLPGAMNPNIDMFTRQLPDRELIQAFISGIPTKYKLATTNNLGSHLSRRKNLSTIPQGLDNADMILFLLNDPFAQPSLSAQREMVTNLKKNKNYKLLFREGDFVVFQKKSLNYKAPVI